MELEPEDAKADRSLASHGDGAWVCGETSEELKTSTIRTATNLLLLLLLLLLLSSNPPPDDRAHSLEGLTVFSASSF